MCLAFLGLRINPVYPTVIAFNRDEVYCRATRPAHWWDDAPEVFAGRDLERHGTWAGVSRRGRLALLTFVRTGESGSGKRSRRSRGAIVSAFLQGEELPEAFLGSLTGTGEEYLPFNLIVGTVQGALFHWNSVERTATELPAGVHGLSNASLNTPWPKVERGRMFLQKWLPHSSVDDETIFRLMQERTCFRDPLLPRTGVPLARERSLSALFVEEEDYGTRTTSLIKLDREGRVQFTERTHPTSAGGAAEVQEQWTLSFS